MQTTSVVMMVRPVRFGYNEQTAVSNAFQTEPEEEPGKVQQKALEEFEAMVQLLRDHGVEVLVLQDTEQPHTPDSIFPNNWISFHQEQGAVLYPMEALNRRLERRTDLPEWLQERGFIPFQVLDMSPYETEGRYLEGTGSMVLDRVNRIAYACRSPRTHPQLLQEWCDHMQYRMQLFSAHDSTGTPIYHTNVLMAVGEKVAIICLQALVNEAERGQVQSALETSGHEVVEITLEQMNRFAGNMLELHTRQGERLMLMSDQAYQSLTEEQRQRINRHARIVHPNIGTIEKYGGGSVRCMMAEVFLPKREV